MDQIEELKKYKSLYDSGAITEEEFAHLKQRLLNLKTDAEKEAAEEAAKEARRKEALAEIEELKAGEEARKAEEARKSEEEARREEEARKAEEERAAAIKQAEEKQAEALRQAQAAQAEAIKKAKEESLAAIKQAQAEQTEAIKKAQAEKTAALRQAQAESLAEIEQEKLKKIDELNEQRELYKQTYSQEKARQDAAAAAALEAREKRLAGRKENAGKAKHIISLIISWIFAAVFLFLMFACLVSGFIGAGIVCIALIIILCPPLSNLLMKIKWIEKHRWIKKIAVAVLVVLFLVLFMIAISV